MFNWNGRTGAKLLSHLYPSQMGSSCWDQPPDTALETSEILASTEYRPLWCFSYQFSYMSLFAPPSNSLLTVDEDSFWQTWWKQFMAWTLFNNIFTYIHILHFSFDENIDNHRGSSLGQFATDSWRGFYIFWEMLSDSFVSVLTLSYVLELTSASQRPSPPRCNERWWRGSR